MRIWHGDLNLRYQSKGNHGGEVNVCQEFQLALAGAPDSSYKSSKKKHTPLLGTLISALIYCFTVFLPRPENAPPREGLTLAPPRPVNFDPCPAPPRPTPKKISPAPPRPAPKQKNAAPFIPGLDKGMFNFFIANFTLFFAVGRIFGFLVRHELPARANVK